LDHFCNDIDIKAKDRAYEDQQIRDLRAAAQSIRNKYKLPD
jgi:hypothetical protein